jgi:UDP-N-acetylmuramoyl-tripeptide--D-alanyl-D-alanine ligase
MQILLSQIAQHLLAQFIGADAAISQVSIDTRTLQAGDLYIAIGGKNFDGHDFILQAELAGAAALMVERLVDTDLPQIIVPDTRIGLAELAALWRQKSSAKIVAVTGSNGKTTVKEMLASILAVNAPVLATKGNLNNDIGVPLTLLRLNENHRYAVIEMGANHPGEIAFSSRYALADVGLINNVGAAHLEGFGSLEGVAQAKGEIISGLSAHSTAILNRDDAFFPLWQALADQRRLISFGLSAQADVLATEMTMHVENQRFRTAFVLQAEGQKIPIALQLAGFHNVINALAATAACLALQIPLAQIKQGLENLLPVTGRLQPYIGRLGNLVIDDSYNANPSSLAVALDVLAHCPGEKVVCLGMFGELGAESESIHQHLGELIKRAGVKRLYAVGEKARFSVDSFGDGGQFFESQAALISTVNQQLTGQETVLIKGSRSQKMEQVAASLVNNFAGLSYLAKN